MMDLASFDYNLPKELIAQYPSERRDSSRLLVLHRKTKEIEHRVFKDIVEYFSKGDLVLLNDTKVVPARLYGRKEETGGRVEALVLNAGEKFKVKGERSEYEVLLKPARGCRVGSRLIFGDGRLKATLDRIENGRRFLRFECNGDLEELLDEFGEMPLPPYIKRDNVALDSERYQTVYAAKKGAVAAPTAGLHFTKDLLGQIAKKGVDVDYITLHVGYGTFKPVKCEDITGHKMEKEYFQIDNKVIEKINSLKPRTVAVGTTTCRALETLKAKGWTDLFIYPPYEFKVVNALLTNFHLPRTTLLMLVSAFCGRELLLQAYKEAIDKKYRFYSYGDAMLIV